MKSLSVEESRNSCCWINAASSQNQICLCLSLFGFSEVIHRAGKKQPRLGQTKKFLTVHLIQDPVKSSGDKSKTITCMKNSESAVSELTCDKSLLEPIKPSLLTVSDRKLLLTKDTAQLLPALPASRWEGSGPML